MLAIAPACELDIERGPDWLLVRVLNVELVESDAPELAERLWRLLEQHFTYRLVLELDGVRSLNSYLIGQLLDLYRRIQEHDGVMRLCGLSPYNCQVLHACRLDDQLLPYEDREAAVMGRPHYSSRPR
jgi:anti-anti-sigma factor